MLNRRSTFVIDIKNNGGQIALFIALIFQILFLFFAMIINVGLLVHHKINLQNSVDLAAYYGAMRQAEGMNVIAHTNYQIRQSWKLLTWRYRALGSAGDYQRHPFVKFLPGHAPGSVNGTLHDGIDTAHPNFYDAPAFCITYVPFSPMPADENTCKDSSTLAGIPLFRPPQVITNLSGITSSINEVSTAFLNSAVAQCQRMGTWNYIILGSFIVAFNKDQAQRSLFIATLARAMSPEDPTGEFYDIDGDSVPLGMRNTFLNNLTPANRNSYTADGTDAEGANFKTYNSLGDPQCNRSGVATNAPPKWLKPVKIAPGFVYVDTECSRAGLRPVRKMLTGDVAQKPQHGGNPSGDSTSGMADMVERLRTNIRIAEPPLEDIYNLSVGVEKNPYCMAYVGVSATASPKIPFSPFGRITLKARAFYKPFGGKIGPWYLKSWRDPSPLGNGSGEGTGDQKTDFNLPPRSIAAGSVGDPTDPTRAANYSRFVGDQYGLKSRFVLYNYAKAVYGLNNNWRTLLSFTGPVLDTGTEPNFDHWGHLPDNFAETGQSQDIMAWDGRNNRPSRMRELEMAAVLPDQFDMAYYSIEPNFYDKYYNRIKDGFLSKVGNSYYGERREFLGDLGTHKGYTGSEANYDQFSVKDQYQVVTNSEAVRDMDLDNQLTYISRSWEHVLTSWAPRSLMNYGLDTSKLGRCTSYPEPGIPTSGNCIAGGSTGYSVKMVSSTSLRDEFRNIGGEGVSGRILNPPPEDDEF